MSKTVKTIIKLVVSIGALVFIFSKIGLVNTWNTMRQADALWLLAAIIIYALSQVISSERVRGMIDAVPLKIDWWVNMKLYWLGMFYNFFLPGGVGGDGYKVYWFKKRHGVKSKPIIMALLGDRISGLVAICIYAATYTAFQSDIARSAGLTIGLQWVALLIPVGIYAYWLFFKLFQRNLVRASFRALALSMTVQALQMSAAAAILAGLGVTEDVAGYLFLFLLSSIASAIPATVGGAGAREGAFWLGAQYMAFDQNIAISLSLLFYFTSLVCSLPGIILTLRTDLIDGQPTPPPESTPELSEVMNDEPTNNTNK